MRIIITFLTVCCLFSCIYTYKQYAGLRVDLNSTFIEEVTPAALDIAFGMLQNLIQPPNNFSISLPWPFSFDLTISDVKSITMFLYKDTGIVSAIERNEAIYIQTPKIQNWRLEFNYDYYDRHKKTHHPGRGRIEFHDTQFSAELGVISKNKGDRFKLYHLHLNMGKDTTLKFTDPYGFLGPFQTIFNDWKKVYQFVIDYFLADIINFVMLLQPITIPIPIFGDYALDLTLAHSFIVQHIQGYSDKISTMKALSVLPRFEGFNLAKNIRADLPKPVDLVKLTPEAKTLSIKLTSHVMDTLFKSMLQSNQFYVRLTDEMVYNATHFLHLRTSDFKYIIPGLLEENGEQQMDVLVGGTSLLPTLDFDGRKLQFKGYVTFDFQVKNSQIDQAKSTPVSKIKLQSYINLNIEAYIQNMEIKGKIHDIQVLSIEVLDCKMKQQEHCKINKDTLDQFNILFRYIRNAVNIYIFGKNIKIPSEIDLEILTLFIKNTKLEMNEGIMDIATDLMLKFL